jgi:iron complex outermembrane receptor protein
LTANAGWTDHEYADVVFDINADGAVDGIDKALEFGRAPEWTYSFGLVHDIQLGSWSMASRISYSQRDEAWFDDDNAGILPEQDIINAGIDFYSNDGHWEVGVYGKNLTNEVYRGATI